ncbi:MAG: Uma2 family endonuclease [Lewinellaceae bacterium]|nr:Uma2 family endonuclease [Saprospiraceae bacterium]MCB9340133.1 Uma2 family endonuclease [Lewinellaceae bacterium]
MEAIAEKGTIKSTPFNVPQYLIKEVVAGIPFYYKDYKAVINKTKTKEEVMGCSSLQSIIIQYLLFNVCAKLDLKKYWILTNEPGNHLGKNNNLSYDIAVVEKSVLTPKKVSRKYMNVPPKLIVEVDVKVELNETDFSSVIDYMFFKTGEVFKHGVQKLIWILSRTGKIVMAENGKPWQIYDWSENLEFMDGIEFNVFIFLEEEGIDPKT